MKLISRYLLYESSVQSPQWYIEYLPQFHYLLLGKEVFRLREDFCGSGKISCEWVKASKENRAVGLDIDVCPLDYANRVNKSILTEEQQSRVNFIQQNVMVPTEEKFDLIGAFNFSFFALHERQELIQYAKAAFMSLKSSGTFFLNVAGGMGILKTRQRDQYVNIPGFGSFQQLWEQGDYNPITSVNEYAIHFMHSSGECLNDAFVYQWRIWQIREVREILAEAGFKKSVVFWERDNKNGEGTGEFFITESPRNAHSWVAYIAGIKVP